MLVILSLVITIVVLVLLSLSCCSLEKLCRRPWAAIGKRYRGKPKGYQNRKRDREKGTERKRENHMVSTERLSTSSRVAMCPPNQRAPQKTATGLYTGVDGKELLISCRSPLPDTESCVTNYATSRDCAPENLVWTGNVLGKQMRTPPPPPRGVSSRKYPPRNSLQCESIKLPCSVSYPAPFVRDAIVVFT